MPRKPRDLDILCLKCGCLGYSYLKKWIKKRSFTRTKISLNHQYEVPVKSVYNVPRSVNDRRILSGLPPLSEREQAKLERLTNKTGRVIIEIGCHWSTIGAIFPLMANKYPHIFATAEVYHSLRVFQKLLEPYTDMKHNAGDWRTYWISCRN
jgi:hypothetical protein